ncbi:MAG TPA: peptidoglycan DD-metalloendopeptidase family protein, partial [Gaiellaceae bacterium]|nr:peptidoglycan DD-metalloendopeptidase family protein [Gaiellaceae bacterium]
MRRFLFAAVVAALALAPSAGAWTWPTDGAVLQGFSFDPAQPYAGGQHRGVDVAGASGGTVAAPASGTVTYTGTVPSSGKSLTITTSDGYAVTLTHLGSISVSRGATVAEGDGVGTIGPTGDPEVSGPYVHLGIRLAADDQGYVDPQSLLPARGTTAGSTGTGGQGTETSPGDSSGTTGETPPGSTGTDDPTASPPDGGTTDPSGPAGADGSDASGGSGDDAGQQAGAGDAAAADPGSTDTSPPVDQPAPSDTSPPDGGDADGAPDGSSDASAGDAGATGVAPGDESPPDASPESGDATDASGAGDPATDASTGGDSATDAGGAGDSASAETPTGEGSPADAPPADAPAADPPAADAPVTASATAVDPPPPTDPAPPAEVAGADPPGAVRPPDPAQPAFDSPTPFVPPTVTVTTVASTSAEPGEQPVPVAAETPVPARAVPRSATRPDGRPWPTGRAAVLPRRTRDEAPARLHERAVARRAVEWAPHRIPEPRPSTRRPIRRR